MTWATSSALLRSSVAEGASFMSSIHEVSGASTCVGAARGPGRKESPPTVAVGMSPLSEGLF
eukprot:6041737-Alexandrium_andersonii.AAC.1